MCCIDCGLQGGVFFINEQAVRVATQYASARCTLTISCTLYCNQGLGIGLDLDFTYVLLLLDLIHVRDGVPVPLPSSV